MPSVFHKGLRKAEFPRAREKTNRLIAQQAVRIPARGEGVDSSGLLHREAKAGGNATADRQPHPALVRVCRSRIVRRSVHLCKKHRPQSEASHLHVLMILLGGLFLGSVAYIEGFRTPKNKITQVNRSVKPRCCAENLIRRSKHNLVNRLSSLPPVEVLHAASSSCQAENHFGRSKQHGELRAFRGS